MKNNKGFTLVEMLAAIIIMGVIATVAVPSIMNYVSASREGVYVQDAKKMIAQAQYRMSSSSTTIEKPMNGEIIAFSLKYLAGNDFRNPPNGGDYDFYRSFVLVTYKLENNVAKYYYAVMLVEKLKDKDEYIGVRLSTEDLVNSDKRDLLIDGFMSSDLKEFDSVDKAYVNKYLGEEELWKDKNVVRYY